MPTGSPTILPSREPVRAVLPWNETSTGAINLVNDVIPNSSHPLFLFLGIEFFQEVNGSMYSLKNGAFNSLAILDVSGE